mmetsp:Transcript_32937/g.71906  ORF Transcript_32937/g.71906 Transcript_32937/m.71906 type:complete len:241 (-) Transcript_32937:1242-1964(-)
MMAGGRSLGSSSGLSRPWRCSPPLRSWPALRRTRASWNRHWPRVSRGRRMEPLPVRTPQLPWQTKPFGGARGVRIAKWEGKKWSSQGSLSCQPRTPTGRSPVWRMLLRWTGGALRSNVKVGRLLCLVLQFLSVRLRVIRRVFALRVSRMATQATTRSTACWMTICPRRKVRTRAASQDTHQHPCCPRQVSRSMRSRAPRQRGRVPWTSRPPPSARRVCPSPAGSFLCLCRPMIPHPEGCL